MYRNLGNKLKVIAKVFRWVLFGALEALGVIVLFTNYPDMGRALAATAIMALAPLLAWISSLPFYAIGHMVENSDIRTDLAIRQYAALRSAGPAAPKAAAVQEAETPQQPVQQSPSQQPSQQTPPPPQNASRPSWGQY